MRLSMRHDSLSYCRWQPIEMRSRLSDVLFRKFILNTVKILSCQAHKSIRSISWINPILRGENMKKNISGSAFASPHTLRMRYTNQAGIFRSCRVVIVPWQQSSFSMSSQVNEESSLSSELPSGSSSESISSYIKQDKPVSSQLPNPESRAPASASSHVTLSSSLPRWLLPKQQQSLCRLLQLKCRRLPAPVCLSVKDVPSISATLPRAMLW